MRVFRLIAGLRCPNCGTLAPSGVFQTLRWRGVHAPKSLQVACESCSSALRLKQKSPARLLMAIAFFFLLMVFLMGVAAALTMIPWATKSALQGDVELNFVGLMGLLIAFVVGALQIYRIYSVEVVPDVA